MLTATRYGSVSLALALSVHTAHCLGAGPNSAAEYYSRAAGYAAKGEVDKAIADYSEALRLKPDFPQALNNRGFIYFGKGDLDKAIADYDEAIRLKPDYSRPYHNRADAYRKKGDVDKAIADYTEVLRLEPKKDPKALVGRAFGYVKKGDLDKAIADCTDAIKGDPKFAAAFYLRGRAYSQQGQTAKAEEDFAQAKKLGLNFKDQRK